MRDQFLFIPKLFVHIVYKKRKKMSLLKTWRDDCLFYSSHTYVSRINKAIDLLMMSLSWYKCLLFLFALNRHVIQTASSEGVKLVFPPVFTHRNEWILHIKEQLNFISDFFHKDNWLITKQIENCPIARRRCGTINIICKSNNTAREINRVATRKWKFSAKSWYPKFACLKVHLLWTHQRQLD